MPRLTEVCAVSSSSTVCQDPMQSCRSMPNGNSRTHPSVQLRIDTFSCLDTAKFAYMSQQVRIQHHSCGLANCAQLNANRVRSQLPFRRRSNSWKSKKLTCRSRSGSSMTRVDLPIALSCRCTSPALSLRLLAPPPLPPASMRPSWLPAMDCGVRHGLRQGGHQMLP